MIDVHAHAVLAGVMGCAGEYGPELGTGPEGRPRFRAGNYVLDGSQIATIDGNSGVALTSAAFGSAISWFPYVLAIAVILFAFSTMISWSYYGLKAWTYLFGEGKNKELVFKLIFCVFVVIGAAANLGPVIDFSDAAIFAMAVVNIFALYFLMKVVRKEFNSYSARLKSGEIKRFVH